MTRLKLPWLMAAAASLAIAAPAAAQVNHSNMPGMTMPMPAKKPAAKKPAAKKPVAKKPAAKKPVAKKPAAKKPASKQPAAKKPRPAAPDPHAGHDMSTMPANQAAPTAPAPAMPGHDMSTMPGAPAQPSPPMPGMPGHDMGAMAAPASGDAIGTNLPAGNAPPPAVPTDHAADAVFGSETMAMGRHHLQETHGGQKSLQVLANIAEYHVRDGRDAIEWDAEGWYGGDINRLSIKTEGEGSLGGSLETFELQALYSRAIDPYWNIQGGLRYDLKPNPSRVYATVGLEGLAPNFFDVEAAIFLSNKGEVMGRAEGWYDQRITQRLILQPRVEVDLAAQNSRDIGIGAGLSKGEVGVRLRYDIRREFAPYVGVQYSRAFGRTRRYLIDDGEHPDGWSLLTGIRMWF